MQNLVDEVGRREAVQHGCPQSVVVAVMLMAVAMVVSVPNAASAFCGFYVSGSQQELYNNATRVAMMRGGQQTVLTMENNYQGPAEDFAMVVPVPQVLDKKSVKTVQDSVFDRLKQLTAPRLVEYWQKDPCPERPRAVYDDSPAEVRSGARARSLGTGSVEAGEPQVTVESKFSAGEYDIVVLSSNESSALDTWLRQNNYNIPEGAAPYFRPYIQEGMYFFVAKVDVDKVEFEGDQAMLSPLRFHYESEDFKLPVRLGLINSNGEQDLISYLLAENQRYRVANYPNVTIPTNLPVSKQVKQGFAQFYDSLFTRVIENNPGAVVTEYSWTATSCDPCPVQPLNAGHLATLGADIIREETGLEKSGNERLRARRLSHGWTVTRLHARYDEETLGEDLVFEPAPAIRGGRGMPQGKEGKMTQQTPEQSGRNNFQGRYVVRHGWEGDVSCDNPNWNRWGARGRGATTASRSPAQKKRGSDETGGATNEEAPELSLSTAIEQSSVPGLEGEFDEPSDGEGEGGSTESSSESTGDGPSGSNADADSDSKNDSRSESSEDPGDLEGMIEEENTETPADELYEGGDARRPDASPRPWRTVGVLALVVLVFSGAWRVRR